MSKEQVVFPLEPVYPKKGITFRQAEAKATRPQGDATDDRGAVDIVDTGQGKAGVVT